MNTAITTETYTIRDAETAVLDFERKLGNTATTARNVIARLAAKGATFEHFEFTGWRRAECSHRAWLSARFEVDAEVAGVTVTVRVTLSKGFSERSVRSALVDVGTRAGAGLTFTSNSDIPAVRSARRALGMAETHDAANGLRA